MSAESRLLDLIGNVAIVQRGTGETVAVDREQIPAWLEPGDTLPPHFATTTEGESSGVVIPNFDLAQRLLRAAVDSVLSTCNVTPEQINALLAQVVGTGRRR